MRMISPKKQQRLDGPRISALTNPVSRDTSEEKVTVVTARSRRRFQTPFGLAALLSSKFGNTENKMRRRC